MGIISHHPFERDFPWNKPLESPMFQCFPKRASTPGGAWRLDLSRRRTFRTPLDITGGPFWDEFSSIYTWDKMFEAVFCHELAIRLWASNVSVSAVAWSENGVPRAFWLGNVLRATTARNCSSLISPDGSTPFLVIMASPNCKVVDFLIFCQDQNSFVAVQVKSNTLRPKPRRNKAPTTQKLRRWPFQ